MNKKIIATSIKLKVVPSDLTKLSDGELAVELEVELAVELAGEMAGEVAGEEAGKLTGEVVGKLRVKSNF